MELLIQLRYSSIHSRLKKPSKWPTARWNSSEETGFIKVIETGLNSSSTTSERPGWWTIKMYTILGIIIMVRHQIELDKERTMTPTKASARQRLVQISNRTRIKSNCKIALTQIMDKWWLRYLLSTLKDLDRFSINLAKQIMLEEQQTTLPITTDLLMPLIILPTQVPISQGIRWLYHKTTAITLNITNKEVLVLEDLEESAHNPGRRTIFPELIQTTLIIRTWAKTQVKTAMLSTLHLQLQTSLILIPLQTKILLSNQHQSQWTTAPWTKIIRILPTWAISWTVWTQPLPFNRINRINRISNRMHTAPTLKTA